MRKRDFDLGYVKYFSILNRMHIVTFLIGVLYFTSMPNLFERE